MMRTKCLFLIAAAVSMLLAPSRVLASEKYLIFNYQDLVSSKRFWPPDAQQEMDEFQAWAGKEVKDLTNISYLIIPSESTLQDTYQNWVVIEDSCQEGMDLLAPVNVPDVLQRQLWQLLVQRKIATANDIVVLDDEDVSNLVRLVWWSRATSSENDTPDRFDLQFLQNVRRSWFLNPIQKKRLLVIRGLTTATARIYVALPGHKGPTPLFEVDDEDRITLEQAITLLRKESIKVELNIIAEGSGKTLKEQEVSDVLEKVKLKLVGSDGSQTLIDSGISRKKPVGSKSAWAITLSRDIIFSAARVEFEISAEDLRFVDQKAQSLTKLLSFPIPTVERILQLQEAEVSQERYEDHSWEKSAVFTLPIATLSNAQGFRSKGVWHSTVDIKDLDIPINPRPLIDEYGRLVKAQAGILVLFESPRKFMMSLDGRRRAGREESQLSAIVNSTRSTWNAVWQQVSIGLAMIDPSSGHRPLVMLIKNTGGITTTIQTRDRIEWGFYLLHSYLEAQIEASGQSGVEILVSERKAVDLNDFGTVSIFVLRESS